MNDTAATRPMPELESSSSSHVAQGLEGLLRGTLAAVCIAIVHLVTLIPAGIDLVPGLLAVAGTAAITLGPLVALRRSAGTWSPGTRSLMVGILAALPILALLGSVLFGGTNHRPLGAVTFAVVAAGVIGVAVVIAGRLTDPSRQLLQAPWAVRFDRTLGLVWFGLVGGAVLFRALRSPDAALVFSAGWQLAAVVSAFILASISPWPRKTTPLVRSAGALVWVCMVVASLVLLHSHHGSSGESVTGKSFAGAVLRAAPLVAWPWAGYR